MSNKTIQCKYCDKGFETEEARNSHEGKKHKTFFKPSEKQIDLLRVMLDPEVKPTITAFCAKVDIARKTYYEWFDNEQFVTWFNAEWERAMAKQVSWLDRVGLMKSPKDFRYWEAMQMKYGKFSKRMDVTSGGEAVKAGIFVDGGLKDEE